MIKSLNQEFVSPNHISKLYAILAVYFVLLDVQIRKLKFTWFFVFRHSTSMSNHWVGMARINFQICQK